MVDGNAKNSVRSRIDALVGAQEARDGVRANNVPREENVGAVVQRKVTTPAKVVRPKVTEKIEKVEKVEKKESNSKRRLFVILASVFGMIVIGLVVAIVIIDILPNNNGIDMVGLTYKMEGYDGPISDSTIASIFNEDVKKRLESDDSYSYEDAIVNYQKVCDETSGILKVYLEIGYANFVYNETSDVDEAINIMNQIDISSDDKSVLGVYYNKMRELYGLKGDDSEVKMYEGYLSDLNGERKEIPMDVVISTEEKNE